MAEIFFVLVDELGKGQAFTAYLLTLPRIATFAVLAQVLGTASMPRLLRAGIIMLLAGFATPITLGHLTAAGGLPGSSMALLIVIMKECLVGTILGFLVGWVFWAMQAAGAAIDMQRGSSLSGVIDPLQGQEMPVLGAFFGQLVFTHLYVTGAVCHILFLLLRSYAVWPVTASLPLVNMPEFPAILLGIMDSLMRFALIGAGPILAVMFLAEFALALISRFAPQLHVFTLAMPIKSGLAMVMLVFYLSRLLPFAQDAVLDTEQRYNSLYHAVYATSFGAEVP